MVYYSYVTVGIITKYDLQGSLMVLVHAYNVQAMMETVVMTNDIMQ